MANKLMYTGPELEQRFDQYWAYCMDGKRRPTAEGFAGYLGISSSTLYRWLAGTDVKIKGDKWDVVKNSLKKCMDRITDYLQQGKDSMSIFLLKQSHYGGYIDKVQQEQSGALTVTVKGSGGVKWGK